MKAEHINPFLRAVTNTFTTMLGAEAHRGELSMGDPRVRKYPVSGIIGLSGKAVGTVVINLSEEAAIKSASKLLLDDIQELNDDVVDAVGELANMIAGQAKVELEQYQLSVSLPSVVTGKGHEVRFPVFGAACDGSYETEFGPMLLEVGFEPTQAPASV